MVYQPGTEVTESFKLAQDVEVTVFFILEQEATPEQVKALVDSKLAEAGLDRSLLLEAQY